MTSEVLQQVVGAGATVTFGRGRIFNLLQAASPVTIVLEGKSVTGGQTAIRKFVNIPAGSKFTGKPGEEWTFLRLTSAAPQTVTLFVGDDDMAFNNAVTVTGVAQVAFNPNSTFGPLASSLDGNLVTAAAVTVPANGARKAITVASPPTNTGTVYLQGTGMGAGPHGIPLQPGTFETLTNVGTFDVRNDSGVTVYLTFTEET